MRLKIFKMDTSRFKVRSKVKMIFSPYSSDTGIATVVNQTLTKRFAKDNEGEAIYSYSPVRV